MKHFIVLLLCCTLSNSLLSQASYQDFESSELGATRGLKIQLPRNYDPESKAGYPLVLVLDGDYLFEPVAGNIDYQAYWEDIPDCIVVGINQSDTRNNDFHYDDANFFPTDAGAHFFDFIEKELLPFIDDTYNTSSFRIAVGHELSANFINYFLFKDPLQFRAYISLSPEFAAEMVSKLEQRLPSVEQEVFYYMATADADIKSLRTAIEASNTKLSVIENAKIHYRFDRFEDANHYSLVGRGIPKALNQIFEKYKPISRKEYKEQVLTYEGSPYDYLINKYEDIKHFYGFEKQVIENDIRAIAAASNKKDDLESLENLSKLVQKSFPESMLKAYYMGMYYEKSGSLSKALQQYQSGLMLQPSQYIDKELMLEKMYDTKKALKN